MARYWCKRCGKEQNTLSEPHLCKDIKRLARRERQVEMVRDLLVDSYGDANGGLAELIVEKLAQMGVTEELTIFYDKENCSLKTK